MEKLFAVRYEPLSKLINIDMLPYVRYLKVCKEDKSWTVYLGLRWHNERWYDLDKAHEELLTLLYSIVPA